jgi:hypothetical protein
LASVVCRPLTFHILIFSSETPLAKWNLVGSIYEKSSILRHSQKLTFKSNILYLLCQVIYKYFSSSFEFLHGI